MRWPHFGVFRKIPKQLFSIQIYNRFIFVCLCKNRKDTKHLNNFFSSCVPVTQHLPLPVHNIYRYHAVTPHLSSPVTQHLSTPVTQHLSSPVTQHQSLPVTQHLPLPVHNIYRYQLQTHLITPVTQHLSSPVTQHIPLCYKTHIVTSYTHQ